MKCSRMSVWIAVCEFLICVPHCIWAAATCDSTANRGDLVVDAHATNNISAVVAARFPLWTGWPHSTRHESRLKAAREGGAPIVFLGDGLVQDFEIGGGRVQWEKYFASGRYRSLNLGFRGECTEHVLWRLDNGELGGFAARAVVIEIGTNNPDRPGGESAIDTILGIRAVVARVRALQPQAKVILHPILPRSESAARKLRNVISKELKWLADGKDVWWCDFSDQLLTADGRLLREISQDGVHYLAYGYEVWANALLPYLDAALDWKDGEGRLVPSRLSAHIDPSIFGSGSLATEPQSIIGHSYTWESRKGWWLDRVAEHRRQVACSGGNIDVVLVGDSISNNWDTRSGGDFAGIAKEFSVLNLGYSGDCTQHVLWRMMNGELDGYRAKVVTLMIGTNNRSNEDGEPENVAAGIKAILAVIREKQPQARIILHPVFPCGQDAKNRVRINNARISALIRQLADGKNIIWCDFNDKLMENDGTISKEMMPDFLHPGRKGYDIWSAVILPIIRSVCKRGE